MIGVAMTDNETVLARCWRRCYLKTVAAGS